LFFFFFFLFLVGVCVFFLFLAVLLFFWPVQFFYPPQNVFFFFVMPRRPSCTDRPPMRGNGFSVRIVLSLKKPFATTFCVRFCCAVYFYYPSLSPLPLFLQTCSIYKSRAGASSGRESCLFAALAASADSHSLHHAF